MRLLRLGTTLLLSATHNVRHVTHSMDVFGNNVRICCRHTERHKAARRSCMFYGDNVWTMHIVNRFYLSKHMCICECEREAVKRHKSYSIERDRSGFILSLKGNEMT